MSRTHGAMWAKSLRLKIRVKKIRFLGGKVLIFLLVYVKEEEEEEEERIQVFFL